MKFLLTFIFCSWFSFSLFSQVGKVGRQKDQFEAIDSVLGQVLKDHHVAGFAVAVVKGDKIIYNKGFGYRDFANKTPVTPNTLFAIGSSSKAFTASLLGLLRADGKLTFEDRAVSLLPTLRFYNDEMDNQIVVKDLMAHRTGLSRYDLSWFLFNSKNRDSLISRVRFMKPSSGLRMKWFYNNFMYLAQGMIVERLSGKTWEQNIQEKFFTPLQMTRSNTDLLAFQRDSDASLPYTLSKDNTIKLIDYYNISGMGPAGSINSSANDMSNWLKVWLNRGYFNGKEILPANYINEAASSQMVMDAALPDKHKDVFLSNYGLGWMIGSYRGHYQVEHGGNINGFSANVAFFPTDTLGIVVLTNQNVSKVPTVVRNSIADILLGLNPIDWNGEKKAEIDSLRHIKKEDEEKLPVTATKPSHSLKQYTGSFENPAYGIIEVRLKDNKLYSELGYERVVLIHRHYDVFDPRSVDKNGVADTEPSNLLFNFFSDVDGQIQGIGILLDGSEKPVMFDRKPSSVAASR
ncbi:serine hydrolase [Sphingobacterium sp. UME9]|uniref:serine hydrolase n=1 Tax=Sphingobacterium sp. UME9 TaxID=1862316 RepID=UPI001600272B|nr:serine hydrolase [Sphingobacterium sp. UME9]MBB1642919.1 hypothetical protein [Sphingobacterium sp. UME9]